MKEIVLNTQNFQHIAHRGASRQFPENTIESFKRAIDIFPKTMFELDIHLTKDNQIVVFHDHTLERTTNGRAPINSKTYDELKELDAGYNITFDKGKSFPFRSKDFRIPLLKEVLERFPETSIIIEVKDNLPECDEILVNIIRDACAEKRVIIGSFHDKSLKRIRKFAPEIATNCGKRETLYFLMMLKFHLINFYKSSADILMLPEIFQRNDALEINKKKFRNFRIISKKLIMSSHKMRMPVYAWTINKKDDMIRLINWGIDGIISDYPDRLLEVVKKREK